MGKILGLDLGSNSIGWAIVDEENEQVIDTGSRVFPQGVENKATGKEISKNAERRNSRMMRRQIFRTKLRKRKLLEYLIHFEMCPLTYEELRQWQSGHYPKNNRAFDQWLRMDPYEIRHRAILTDEQLKREGKNPINREELGRVFYSIAQHRGFKSTRKAQTEKSNTLYKGGEGITGIDDTKQKMQKGGFETLGSYLHHIHPQERMAFKRILDDDGNEERVRARYTLREWYEEEFEKIWENNASRLDLNDAYYTRTKRKFIGNPEKSKNQKYIKRLQTKGIDYELIPKGESGQHDIKLKIPVQAKSLFGDPEKGVLFYQRPLQSQKHLLSRCTFESFPLKIQENGKTKTVLAGKPTCPQSHPLFELYRAYKFINSVEYDNQKLSQGQKEIALEIINREKSNFDFSKLKDQLGLPYAKFNYEDSFKVAGNTTHALLKPLLGNNAWEDPSQRDEFWHLFHYFNDDEALKNKLKAGYGFSDRDVEKAQKVNLKDDNANLSLKAINNILPFLKEGYEEDKAILLGGIRNAFGLNSNNKTVWDQLTETDQAHIKETVIGAMADKPAKEGEVIRSIKEFLASEYDLKPKQLNKLYHHSQETQERPQLQRLLDQPPDIRNPIVQQTLYELKRLVNHLSEQYLDKGEHFQAIKVELARELKQPKSQRTKQSRVNEARKKENDEAKEVLNNLGLSHTRTNIHKYLLWKEIQLQNGTPQCPYTGTTINLSDLLGRQNKFQIEHIIPYSISLDDSFANKTLCESKENGLKGEKTPYQFYKDQPEKWGKIKERAFSLLPYNKAKKFTQETIDQEDFIERQLNDTRYISREAKNFLDQICNDVQVFPGTLTAELRKKWGLNSILNPGVEVHPATLQGQYWLSNNDEETEYPELHPIFNIPPNKEADEIIISGKVNEGNEKVFDSNFLKTTIPVSADYNPGKYWAKVRLNTEPVKFQPIYRNKPVPASESEIVISGVVELRNKNESEKVFNANSLSNKLPVGESYTEDRKYWAKLPLLTEKTKFLNAKKHRKPKASKNQIVLFGEINDGLFESYIYQCQTDLEPGKYWALLEVNPDQPELEPKQNEQPEIQNYQVLLNGGIRNGHFYPDMDEELEIPAENHFEEGRYWAVFDIEHDPHDFVTIRNEAPDSSQSLVTGVVNKVDGGKRFFPEKQRDDHRHHAIDALTVAVTQRSHLQKLSTYSAEKKSRKQGKEAKTLTFDEPWPNFRSKAEASVKKILVSHKQNNRVYTKVNKPVRKNGKKYQGSGKAARGQLHKDTIYGKRQSPERKEISFHVNVDIKEFDNKSKIDNKLVDPGIRTKIYERVNELGGFRNGNVPQNTYFKIDEHGIEQPQIFLPNGNGEPVPVKTVRKAENLNFAEQLRDDMNAYVNPRNNHHIIIYKDQKGELQEKVTTLWESVERKKNGLPVVNQAPEEDATFVTSLQENDMFILGLSDEEMWANKKNKAFLSSYLYRVQKLSSGDYNFRHHLGSITDDNSTLCRMKSFKKWREMNPIKVKVSIDGAIEPI